MTLHKWTVGAALTTIMVLALAANAVLFSVRSFQHHLAEIAPSSYGILNVRSFLAADAEIAAIEAGVAAERGRAIALQMAADQAAASAQAAEAQAAQLGIEIAQATRALEGRLSLEAALEAGAEDGTGLARRLDLAASAPSLQGADRELAAALRLEAERLIRLETDAAVQREEAGRARLALRAAAPVLEEADQKILGLKAHATPGQDAALYETIRSQVLAVTQASPLGIGATLVQTHPHFLSIGLVLLMGLLGGILYLFPAYMSRPNPVTFAEIIVRMIFGMCTALAFYVLMNAAVAGFSFAPGQEPGAAGAALNPFTVSLVGIVGGVMADDIARWIHQRGSEILGQAKTAASAVGGLAPSSPPPREAEFDPMADERRAALADEIGPR